MKNIFIILLLLICYVSFADGESGGIKMIRGLTLKIVDAETGSPLPNIPVYYKLVKAKPRFLSLTWKNITVVNKVLLTDNNGCVFIRSKRVFLGIFQYLSYELFYINIDIDKVKCSRDKFEHFNDYFILLYEEGIFFPNHEYYPARSINDWDDFEGFTLVQKSESRNKDERFIRYPSMSNLLEENDISITIELIRRNSHESKVGE